jgi:hypothetical protein
MRLLNIVIIFKLNDNPYLYGMSLRRESEFARLEQLLREADERAEQERRRAEDKQQNQKEADKRAEQEQRRAEEANERVEQERRRAEDERRRAEDKQQNRQKAESCA